MRLCSIESAGDEREMIADKNNLDGFKIIRCGLSQSLVTYELFIKKHSARNQSNDKPADRTLIIANVPPWMKKKDLKSTFSEKAGAVKSVILQQTLKDGEFRPKDNGFKFAFVVFKKSASLQKALSLENTLLNFTSPNSFGLHSWIRHYNKSVEEQDLLQQKVKEVIDKYDREEDKRAKAKGSTDDEGWTLVSKKGRNPGGSRTETSESKAHERLKRKEKGLTNFYTFQIKESKMKEIATLRKKHEEDKKKIEAIRKSRKFKPY